MSFSVFAQDNHTVREEREGRAIWGKLQVKQIACDKLSNEDFERLGEYYMGQMTGSSHKTMNTMMERMIGKDSEEQMHIVMGKKLSGCDTSAQFPNQGGGVYAYDVDGGFDRLTTNERGCKSYDGFWKHDGMGRFWSPCNTFLDSYFWLI